MTHATPCQLTGLTRDTLPATVTPITIATARRRAMAEVQAELDRPRCKELILNHLWLINAKHCSCGKRPASVKQGGLYDWYADHLSTVLADAGYSCGGVL